MCAKIRLAPSPSSRGTKKSSIEASGLGHEKCGRPRMYVRIRIKSPEVETRPSTIGIVEYLVSTCPYILWNCR